MRIDPADLDQQACYKLMTGIMVPRPIAFVSTVSKSGLFNVAPFSWFTAVSHKPPILAYQPSMRRVDRTEGKADTARNAQHSGDFVVNVVTYDIERAMADASAAWPEDVSEFDVTGLTPLPSEQVKAPRVAESPINMECRLLRVMEFGGGRTSLIFGEVVLFHFRDDLFRNGELGFTPLRITGRMAGILYTRTHHLFDPLPPT